MKKKLKKKHTVKKRKSILRKSSFWWSVFFVSLFGAVFYFFFLYPYFYVENVYIEGFEIENIEEIAQPYIEKDFILFSSKSIFFASLPGIKEEVLDNFHEIKDVEIKRVFPHSLKIEATKRKAVASWCTDDSCFKVDESGVVFDKGKGGDILFHKNTNSELGEKVTTKEEMNAMQEINKHLDEVNFFVITNKGEHTKIEADILEGCRVKFILENDIYRQLDNLEYVLREKIKDIENVEYINLMYTDKVYYKEQ